MGLCTAWPPAYCTLLSRYRLVIEFAMGPPDWGFRICRSIRLAGTSAVGANWRCYSLAGLQSVPRLNHVRRSAMGRGIRELRSMLQSGQSTVLSIEWRCSPMKPTTLRYLHKPTHNGTAVQRDRLLRQPGN